VLLETIILVLKLPVYKMSDIGSDDLDEEKGQSLGEYDGERNEKSQRHGHGKATLPNGDTYEGMYEYGQRNGTGTYRFKNGARYVGDWLKNKKHGKGTFIYPDGSKYEGDWVDDQRCGNGMFYYVNGDTYDGDWRAHKRHGYGVYTYADTGSRYVGMWKDGLRNGHGELVHVNHKYVGKFSDDKPLGNGKYVFDIGCMQYGEYVLVEQPAGGVDEDDTKQVPKWRAQGIGEVVFEPEPVETRPTSAAPESTRVDESTPQPQDGAGDSDEVLDQTSADDRVSHTEEQSADADDALPPPEPTTNEAPAEDEEAEEMEELDAEED
jgi:radial spoke head protein 1